MAASKTVTAQPALTHLAPGAYPTATFPNDHLISPAFSRTQRQASAHAPLDTTLRASSTELRQATPVEELRELAQRQDWEELYGEGQTKICMRAEWCADEQRCRLLQCLVRGSQARRVLEIGSFCGAGTLAMAEALPEDGQVHVLELDPFVVSLGRPIQLKSPAFHKLKHTIGQARETLHSLSAQAREGKISPFDLVIVDADKESMLHYFRTLFETPGLLSEDAVVCVDVTPFKGQVPIRFVKYSFPYRWSQDPGFEAIEQFRTVVKEAEDFTSHETGNLLIVQRRQEGGSTSTAGSVL